MKSKNFANVLLAAFTGALLASGTSAAAADSESPWRFDTSLNLFLAGLSGDVAVKGIPAKVDASFGDVLDHLEAGAAGKVKVGYQRWSLATEFSYMRLSAVAPGASVKFEQWLVEPSIGYRFSQYIEAFAGARYNSISGDVTFGGPAGKVPSGTQDWWDPIIGTQLSYPLGKSFSLEGHFDIGGAGVGSDITWQAYPYVNWRFSNWGSAQLGYRWLGTDYSTGSGASRFRYDVVVQGPQVGLTVHF